MGFDSGGRAMATSARPACSRPPSHMRSMRKRWQRRSTSKCCLGRAVKRWRVMCGFTRTPVSHPKSLAPHKQMRGGMPRNPRAADHDHSQLSNWLKNTASSCGLSRFSIPLPLYMVRIRAKASSPRRRSGRKRWRTESRVRRRRVRQRRRQ